MRHRKAGIKLNRTSSHRKAMFRNMVTSLIKYKKIRTTHAKAMALRSWADYVITLAKRGDLHARRQVLAVITEKNVVHKLFDEMVGHFKERNGGYTRVIKLEKRPGDAAPMAIIELVTLEGGSKKKEKWFKKKEKPYIEPTVSETATSEDKVSSTEITSAEPAKTIETDTNMKDEATQDAKTLPADETKPLPVEENVHKEQLSLESTDKETNDKTERS